MTYQEWLDEKGEVNADIERMGTRYLVSSAAVDFGVETEGNEPVANDEGEQQ